ncbi:MAG: hypothetical protein PHY74_02635 [Candidatus Bathyarchaeota archaeon]|nr:hypothetical protein [Candidatus Bathyarchaeota archaeon]MDD4326201.1 hypothetical protein [Candidatus Bathyarchaeota archaeon]MDI9577093.1 hypothetical protein [Thermoproteota archaeon]MDT8782812.1 hypothetical protein [Candidatus Bathyarchaeota archaeon]NLD66179.1 hypothetical protein [Thermoproteota archaeon]
MAKIRVDGLNINSGPTQSGLLSTPVPVGGEFEVINMLTLLFRYWPLLLLLFVPIGLWVYYKRNFIPKWIWRFVFKLRGI